MTVIRRVGGLEGLGVAHETPGNVIRRVGGLEDYSQSIVNNSYVIRRVGGLEVFERIAQCGPVSYTHLDEGYGPLGEAPRDKCQCAYP